MQKLIAYILLTIFSINSFAFQSAKESCCSKVNTSHHTSSSCKKSCCTKEKKSPKKHTHKCCQLITPSQHTYAVNSNNSIVVEQTSKKSTNKSQYAYSFQNFFKKFTIINNDVIEHQVLFYSPKKYIQHCTYLI
jgi:hypothetical protein